MTKYQGNALLISNRDIDTDAQNNGMVVTDGSEACAAIHRQRVCVAITDRLL